MKKSTLITTAEIAIITAIISVCAWITIPMAVPITLQTFGVFMALQILGGKNGTISILIYILLGFIGVPVFSGFSGGAGIILGPTGGYIIGFMVCGIIFWATEKIQKNTVILTVFLVLGLLSCYTFGTIWFAQVYSSNGETIGLGAVLGTCVLPFIIPDLIKLALSIIISKKVKKILPKVNKI